MLYKIIFSTKVRFILETILFLYIVKGLLDGLLAYTACQGMSVADIFVFSTGLNSPMEQHPLKK